MNEVYSEALETLADEELLSQYEEIEKKIKEGFVDRTHRTNLLYISLKLRAEIKRRGIRKE